MSQNWQLAIVLICVAAAAGWVAREVRRLIRPKNTSAGSCGSCGSCPSPPATNADRDASLPLVTLELKDPPVASPIPSGKYVPKRN